MAQVNITLSQEEVLQVLSGNRDKAFKYLVQRILNEIMAAGSATSLPTLGNPASLFLGGLIIESSFRSSVVGISFSPLSSAACAV